MKELCYYVIADMGFRHADTPEEVRAMSTRGLCDCLLFFFNRDTAWYIRSKGRDELHSPLDQGEPKATRRGAPFVPILACDTQEGRDRAMNKRYDLILAELSTRISNENT